jgi:Skp family chaperone for outer membrane proteins
MLTTTRAFQEIIATANKAHRIYNLRGPKAGVYALAELKAAVETLMQHIQSESDAKEARKS